jgi:hypothetical protein
MSSGGALAGKGDCAKNHHALELAALEINDREDDGNELLQTLGTQDSVAGDNRFGGDPGWLDAVLQSTGSESGDFHSDGRGRRLPGKERAPQEKRESADGNQLALHIGQQGNRGKGKDPTRRS